ncbi:MAG: hypothetical protein LBU32_16445 [Clostridiales bacterium]|nr:hypothetical protein [Clostridiales bacterium]
MERICSEKYDWLTILSIAKLNPTLEYNMSRHARRGAIFTNQQMTWLQARSIQRAARNVSARLN